MRNILFITPDFYPNSTGFANASLNLLNSIREFGSEEYSAWVLTDTQLGSSKEISDFNIVRYGHPIPVNRITFKFAQYLKFKFTDKFIKSRNIDVIFFETNTFPYLQNYLVKKYPKKTIVRIHSTMDTEIPVFPTKNDWFTKQCNRKIFEFMNDVRHILSTSSYYIDFVKHYYLKDNVFKIWFDKKYGYLYNTAGADIVQNNAIYSNEFLTLGKMSSAGLAQKGIEDLLYAVNNLKTEKVLPHDFVLRIIGSGNRINVVKEIISKCSLDNYVELIEKATHSEVFKYISKSKAIILLSRFEGQSMFITETIASGKPIIITGNNGMQDMVVDGYNGFVVKTGDVKDITEAIKKYISIDRRIIEEQGRNSRVLYESLYQPRKIYEQFDNFIKSI